MSPLNARSPQPISSDILLMLFALAVGIFLSHTYHLPLEAPLILLPSSLILIVISLKLHGNLNHLGIASKLLKAGIISCFFSLGILTESLNRPIISFPPTDSEGNFYGEVLKVKTKATGDMIIMEYLTPECSKTGIKGYMRLSSGQIQAGDIIRCRGQLSRVNDSTNRMNDGFRRYLLSIGITTIAKCKPNEVSIIGYKSSPAILAQHIRTNLEIGIENSGLKKPTVSFLVTVLLGDKSFLDPTAAQTFSDAGVSHVLALSGMHIGIIVFILMTLLFPLNFTGNYRLRYYVTFILLWVYAFISGFSETIVRATLMTSFSFIAMLLQRKNSSFNALCLACLLILVVSPEALFSISLQLSFLCVAAIIIFSEPMNPINMADHPYLYKFFGLITTSLIATFATWILTAYFFSSLPLLFLPANILILPLLPLYLSVAIIYLILHSIEIQFDFLATLIDSSYSGLLSLLNLISAHGEAVVRISPSLISVCLWLAGITVLAISVNTTRRKKILILSSTFILCLSICLI